MEYEYYYMAISKSPFVCLQEHSSSSTEVCVCVESERERGVQDKLIFASREAHQ